MIANRMMDPSNVTSMVGMVIASLIVPTLKMGQEVTSQERAYDGHNDIDQQARAVMHEFSRHPADYCSNDKVYKKVHFYLLCESLSCTKYRVCFC